MSGVLRSGAYSAPVDHERVRLDWAGEGFSFGVFRDPPGQEWNDFVHESDEYVLVAEGAMEITVGAERFKAAPGDLVRIPRNTSHSLRTLSASGSVWLYGYGFWEGGDG
ncbi:cupin domain-containing protein [Pelagibius sp. 7325]|uniref:cupin domain-containing protein n=1 Tax=Pelagibius sp. 7325 TaxID=3131994 RepID=UPI0030EEAE9D